MEELKQIVTNFQENEVSAYGNLPEKTQRFISISVLTTLGTLKEIPAEVEQALKEKISPEEIAEAIIQCTPYIGYSKVMEALEEAETEMIRQGVKLPLSSRNTTTDESRIEKGLAAQYTIFGKENIERNRETAPPELRHIQDYLSGYCFGDFYTRSGLDLQTRELLTFCTLCTLGGCEPQLKAHIGGNLQVGNDRQTLISAVTWCLPNIGFPRTLNAIACINEIAK
ncbi:carboxymuconolactone decarboxylase family protein [Blautia sp.]|uniref:carboxymuconolactone decarboxylase family protein n=1 Tax=Blautia sp. TaxID=1955243 RepID=UPI003AB5A287